MVYNAAEREGGVEVIRVGGFRGADREVADSRFTVAESGGLIADKTTSCGNTRSQNFEVDDVLTVSVIQGVLTMSFGYKRIAMVTAVFMILAVTDVYFGISFAKSNALTVPPAPDPPPITAILTTHGNRPITVNGSTAISGATIVAGSIIETPDQVGGTINLGAFGSLEVEPNTQMKLDFDQNGNMKVTLVRGCATARTKKNVIAEIATSQGVAGKTEPKSLKGLTVCFPLGATAPTVSVTAGTTAATSSGLVGAVIGGIASGVALPVVLRGANPSPSSP